MGRRISKEFFVFLWFLRNEKRQKQNKPQTSFKYRLKKLETNIKYDKNAVKIVVDILDIMTRK
jgi:G:T-mismatch repair DNA endonuclease (very short patch repair protein)